MRYTVTCEDLAWLEEEGYWVDPEPDVLPDDGSITISMGCYAPKSRSFVT
jgi:hypothetical protein